MGETFYAHFGNIGQVVDEFFQMHYVILKIWRSIRKCIEFKFKEGALLGSSKESKISAAFFLRSVVSSSRKAYCCGTKARFS